MDHGHGYVTCDMVTTAAAMAMDTEDISAMADLLLASQPTTEAASRDMAAALVLNESTADGDDGSSDSCSPPSSFVRRLVPFKLGFLFNAILFH